VGAWEEVRVVVWVVVWEEVSEEASEVERTALPGVGDSSMC
jgi:hypothetical protein